MRMQIEMIYTKLTEQLGFALEYRNQFQAIRNVQARGQQRQQCEAGTEDQEAGLVGMSIVGLLTIGMTIGGNENVGVGMLMVGMLTVGTLVVGCWWWGCWWWGC